MKPTTTLREPPGMKATAHGIAAIAHNINRAYCLAIGDDSQPEWREAPVWQQESCINGVVLILEHPETTPEASHASWMAQKESEGWVYGVTKDPEKKTHPCILPYHELPLEQRVKDHLFGAVVRELAPFWVANTA